MKPSRVFPLLCAFLSALALSVPAAWARSSDRGSRGNRGGRDSGPYRLIGDGQDRSDRGGKRDDTKKPDSTKKPDTTTKPATTPKPTAPKPTPTVARPPAAPKPTTTAPKPGTGPKTDDAREEEATQLYEQASAALDQGTEQGLLTGVGTIRQVLADYDGTDAADKARQQLDLLLADAKLGPMILLAEAQDEFDSQHYRKARNKFRGLVERYPDSEQATQARARLAEIEEKDLLKKSLYTDEELEDARLWYLAGNIHLENGRKGDALASYRRVIEEYPGCRYAVLSEEKLPAAQGS
jgi:outer membrane protein assembly factor BamD (BamD/ComL family)